MFHTNPWKATGQFLTWGPVREAYEAPLLEALLLDLGDETHAAMQELVERNASRVVGAQLHHDLLHRILHVQLSAHHRQVLTENRTKPKRSSSGKHLQWKSHPSRSITCDEFQPRTAWNHNHTGWLFATEKKHQTRPVRRIQTNLSMKPSPSLSQVRKSRRSLSSSSVLEDALPLVLADLLVVRDSQSCLSSLMADVAIFSPNKLTLHKNTKRPFSLQLLGLTDWVTWCWDVQAALRLVKKLKLKTFADSVTLEKICLFSYI